MRRALLLAASVAAAPTERASDSLVERPQLDLASRWYNATGQASSSITVAPPGVDGSMGLGGASSNGGATDSCGVEVTFSAQGCCGENAYAGALEAFALSASGTIMHTFQRTGKGWEAWAPLFVPGERNLTFASGPTLVRAGDGRLEIFANAADTAIYHKYQLAPNGGAGWSPWLRIADSFGMEGAPAAVLSSEGSMQLFSRSIHQTLMYNAQLRNASGVYWAGWQTLSGELSGSPSAVIDSESMLHVFVRGVQSQLFEKAELADPATGALAWSRWTCLGGSLASHPSVPLVLNGANLLEVFARHDDGSIWFKKQHATDTVPYEVAWSDWQSLGAPGEGATFASGPSVAHSPTCDGVVELFARASNGAIYHKRQVTQGSSQWSLWSSLGGSGVSTPASLYTASGELHAFALGADGQVYHTSRDSLCAKHGTGVNASTGASMNVKWPGWKPLPLSPVPLVPYAC